MNTQQHFDTKILTGAAKAIAATSLVDFDRAIHYGTIAAIYGGDPAEMARKYAFRSFLRFWEVDPLSIPFTFAPGFPSVRALRCLR